MRVHFMAVKAVVFDLDGTIATFNLDFKTLRSEVRGYLMKSGVPASVLNINENIFEMLKKTEIFMKNQGKPAELLEKIRRGALSIAEKHEMEAAMHTSLLPGAADTLQAIKRKGMKIGLCTVNGQKSMDYILKRFNIAEYFGAAIPREKVNYIKPNPEHLEVVLKALGVTPAETVVVGDSVIDVKAAKELKAIAVGLPTGVSTTEQLIHSGANYIITSITDLPILIEGINKVQQKT
jgi:HAD superfamily hydrolase (TIGR01509 family)